MAVARVCVRVSMDWPRCPAAPDQASPSLWRTAEELSGVSCEEAFAIDRSAPSVYEHLGGGDTAEAVLRRLSTVFYERVYADTEPLPSGALLRHAFANTTRAQASANQSTFLIERLGGPKVYTRLKGSASLVGRHAPYAGVTHEGAQRWLRHMAAALASVPEIDDDVACMLLSFFRFHAAWIVEGRKLLNPQRLIGYGDSMHTGHVHGSG